MKIKRNGYTRTVYLVGKWAIKVPTLRNGTRGFVMGMYANIQERDIWRQVNEIDLDALDHLAAVYFSFPFGLLNIAKRYPSVEPELSEEQVKTLPFIGLDAKSDNFSITMDGKLILIDYGNMSLYLVHEKNKPIGG